LSEGGSFRGINCATKNGRKNIKFGPGWLGDLLHELLHQPYDEVLRGRQVLFPAGVSVHKPKCRAQK
jgi:hypothetical protein